ncbi:MAG: hypothetical protein CME36_11470 [unclassified Hahellaceae]|nr:hypothetical protein [Hahellaceae bacterium]|tara:strand:- start:6974 stop:7408 length:435 start_codon:yes stop_codon:yes gene_type:complete
MLAFLILHITALLLWVASLMYLPALIASGYECTAQRAVGAERPVVLARLLFTKIATPAALVAILAGTGVFVLNRTVDAWLIIKLTLVTGLVVAHCTTGFLVVKSEAAKPRPVVLWCWLTATFSAALATGIVWIVLGKPDFERLL